MPQLTAEPAVETGSSLESSAHSDAGAEIAPKSDEELVGLEPEPYRAEYKSSDVQRRNIDADSQTSDEAVASKPDEATPDQGLPETLQKTIAANPEVKAELLRLWEENQAFQQIFPTPAEARAVKELFPGGAEQAKAALSKAMEMERSDAMFASRDPRLQRELASSMLEFDPEAFGAMLQAGAEVVREKNPELYHAFVSGLMSPVASTASAEPRLSMPLRESPHDKWLRRELDNLSQQQAASFVSSINQSAMPQIDTEIRKLIEPVTKGLPEYAREGAMQSLIQQIHGGIVQRLKSDQHYHAQLALMSQNFGAQNHDVASKAVVSRALLHLKPVAKQVFQAWTPRQIEQGRQTAEKAESAARRTDIGGGGLTYGRPHSKLTKDEARELSDEQLIDWALRRS